MSKDSRQNPRIVKLFDQSQKAQELKEEDLENFSKSLLIFGRNSANYSNSTRSCQVASLEDLKSGTRLKIKNKDQNPGFVIQFEKPD